MPRDPQRIDPLLNNIKKIWATKPDLRLNQLLSILSKTYGDARGNDLFYFEDSDLEIAIEKYMRMHGIK